jgi:hypothetical protein
MFHIPTAPMTIPLSSNSQKGTQAVPLLSRTLRLILGLENALRPSDGERFEGTGILRKTNKLQKRNAFRIGPFQAFRLHVRDGVL